MKGCTPNVAQALVPYPQYCNNIAGGNENIGASTYNALQVKVEKRMSRGFWLLTSYTWSKTMTNADSAQSAATTWSGLSGVISPFERTRNKGLAADDVPQMLSLSLVYDLPFGAGKRLLSRGGVLNNVVGGWQASTVFRDQSGAPLFFRSGFCNVPYQFAAGCIPGVLPGASPFAQFGGFDPGLGPLFNRAAFEPVSNFNFDLGQGSRITNYRAFGYHNQDFGLSKTTRVTEKVGIEIRVDAFNIWNWHTFTINGNSGFGLPVNNDVSSPTFGTWNGAVSAPRNIQVGAKIVF
jgi:hypothetical protein